MSINYDLEELEKLIERKKEHQMNVENGRERLFYLIEKIYSLSLPGFDKMIESKFDELEDDVSNKYLIQLEEYIDTIINNNHVIEDTDNEIKGKFK